MVAEKQAGFTIVEVLVTLVVTTLFLTLFFQAYLTVESQRIGVVRRAKASDIAYTNLRKFSNRPATLTCDSARMDLTAADAATKPGVDISGTSPSYGFVPESADVMKSLGTGARQVVLAYAPRGCGNFANSPIKIVSKVIYSGNRETVTHASYIN